MQLAAECLCSFLFALRPSLFAGLAPPVAFSLSANVEDGSATEGASQAVPADRKTQQRLLLKAVDALLLKILVSLGRPPEELTDEATFRWRREFVF